MVALLKDALRAAEEAAGKAAAFKPTTESTLERIRAVLSHDLGLSSHMYYSSKAVDQPPLS